MSELAGSLWFQWEGHAGSLLGIALLQGLYLLGVGPLRERYGLSDSIEPRQIATFTAGVVVIFFALTSPIHVLAENFLFSMHMLQHVLLTLVAPPLLILGTPDWLLRPLLRPNWAFRTARIATNPLVTFAAFNMVFALWHFPALYDTSLTIEWMHAFEHALMISTAVLVWWPITSMMPELPRLNYPLQMGYLFAMSVAQIIVFGIITFARHPIYDFYINAPRVWGISPLADQQIGAMIMKVGGGVLFLSIIIYIFFKWYNSEEALRKADAEEHYGSDHGLDGPTLEDGYR
ncbi:MAG: cytochrome c oxidase assembly protein [Chloroflexi bacterium]|nr:cytochrome c oxidase assembly protein [Chloroflexota bacterium]